MILDSKKTTFLIFSDVHQETEKLQKILTKENYDEIIFVGDIFDSHYYDDRLNWFSTVELVKKYFLKDNFHWILGNHDCHYLFKNENLRCSGFMNSKKRFYEDKFGPILIDICEKVKYYVLLDNYLISHAGLHPSHIPVFLNIKDRVQLDDWLNKESQKAFEINNFQFYPLSWMNEAGKDRDGRANYGGLTWMDWNTLEPIEGLDQIVGHTFGRQIKTKIIPNSSNICIDTNINHYLLVENGNIKIKLYADL